MSKVIYKKLAEIQKELFVPKGQHNDFGKYNYRSCEDILQAVKPICDAKGCVLHITNEMETVGDRVYVKAKVTLIDAESGETIESTAHAREENEKRGMDSSQITGAASSYARKYALAGLFCIDNEKDSDATNNGKTDNKANNAPNAPQNEQKDSKSSKATKKQIDAVKGLIKDIDAMLKFYKIEKIEDLTKQQASQIIASKSKKQEG